MKEERYGIIITYTQKNVKQILFCQAVISCVKSN
jgi:hypothetical protein